MTKQINIQTPLNQFETFLGSGNNKRIVFSGIFGSGKTYFLRHFFKEKQDKYITLHLFPTNYIVSNNEDIFELIKFDIFYELLRHKPNLERLDVKYLEAVPFAANDLVEKTNELVSDLVPKVGKSMEKIIKMLFDLNSVIKEKVKEIQDNSDEGLKIAQFAKEMFSKKGHAYERDFYTQLIIALVKRFKETGQEVVLVVDDLDRIDPDQIFRILNIFSAHFDTNDDTNNKFDFDKIIVCCDVDNIHQIFNNRFGQDVDFSGYIDKFCSTEIFHFDNRLAVKSEIDRILQTLTLANNILWNPHENPTETVGYGYIRSILYCLIESNSFNLRQLLALRNSTFRERKLSLILPTRNTRTSHEIYIASFLEFLFKLFASKSALIRAIRHTNFSRLKHAEFDRFVVDLLLMIDCENNLFNESQNNKYKLNNLTIIYDVIESRNPRGTRVLFANISKDSDKLDDIKIDDLLLGAINKYASIRAETIN